MTTSTPITFSVQLTTAPLRIMHDVVPNGKVRRFTMIQFTSIDPVNEAKVTCQWLDQSATPTLTAMPLLYQTPVPVADAIPVNVGAFSLQEQDDLQAFASANGDIQVTTVYYDETVSI